MNHALFLEPVDVLLFRDARPFVAGEGHLARSLFPPPGTVYGGVRTCLLEAMGVPPAWFGRAVKGGRAIHEFPLATKLLGLERAEDGLACVGPFVAQRGESGVIACFACPLDLGHAIPGRRGPLRMLPARGLPVITDLPAPLLSWSMERLGDDDSVRYLSEEGLRRYLLGQELPLDEHVVKTEEELFTREIRPGVGLEWGRKTAKEGLLYWVEFLRLLEGVGFVVALSTSVYADQIDTVLQHLSPPQPALIGGEGRLVRISPVPWTPIYRREEVEQAILKRIEQDGRFVLLLLTPAFWSAGWRPDFVVGDLTEEWQGGRGKTRIRLVGAAVGEPLPLGGWDLAEGRPKPMQKAVPAGSVYYFALEEGSGREVLNRFHGKSFGRQSEAGYGHMVVGAW